MCPAIAEFFCLGEELSWQGVLVIYGRLSRDRFDCYAGIAGEESFLYNTMMREFRMWRRVMAFANSLVHGGCRHPENSMATSKSQEL